MERKLIVTLLQKNIQELAMITEGFMEMTEYPAVIIQLARQKTEDVLDYVSMLEEMKKQNTVIVPDTITNEIEAIMQDDIELIEQAVDKITEETAELIEEVKIVKKIAEEEAKMYAKLVEQEALQIELEAKEAAAEAAKAKKIAEEEAAREAQKLAAEEERLAKEAADKKEREEAEAKKLAEFAEKARQKAEEAKLLAEKEAEEKAKQEAEKVSVSVKPAAETKLKTVASEHIKQKGESEKKVSDAHSQKKIDDINQAISMGNRFRFQRELFDGNGELMNKTLAKLNQISNFKEADEFLQKNFKWQSDNEIVDSFYQIVKRKFI